MSKEVLVMAVGIWLLLIPYLGVPGSWRTTIIVLTGALLIILGFLLRAEIITRTPRKSPHHPFVENSDTLEMHAHSTPHVVPHLPKKHDVPKRHVESTAHDRKERITSLN